MEDEYEEFRERFTWRNQASTDKKMIILSPIETQLQFWCLYHALKVTLESNFRVQMGRDVKFSVHELYEISKEAKKQFPNKTSTYRLLLQLKDTGVLSEDGCKIEQESGVRYYLNKVSAYTLDNLDDIRNALYMLKLYGPLLAVIYISKNYDKCIKTGEVYKYEPEVVNGNVNTPLTHAITVVSFAIENGPFFHCQDSQGINHGEGGFLKVDVTSIKELYSFTIKGAFCGNCASEMQGPRVAEDSKHIGQAQATPGRLLQDLEKSEINLPCETHQLKLSRLLKMRHFGEAIAVCAAILLLFLGAKHYAAEKLLAAIEVLDTTSGLGFKRSKTFLCVLIKNNQEF